MCGFIVSKIGRSVNDAFVKRRGGTFPPMREATPFHHLAEGFHFRHYLLHVTGQLTPQPYVDLDRNIVALYNGEIYNLEFSQTDGENIIPAYLEAGELFPCELDGEFAIALYDFGRDLALFATDRFGTKPLWRRGAECASYESALGGHKIAANMIEAVRISTGETLGVARYHLWDWRQHVGAYDACIDAMVHAIRKRFRDGCFIGLSSGYDSGAIACALKGKEFKAYSIVAAETESVLLGRARALRDVEIIGSFDIAAEEHHLRENAEDFAYHIRYDDRLDTSSYKGDYAAKALSHICRLAHGEGRKVYLSGSGADEILSDYSLIPKQSEFKGRFPEHLMQWSNFNDSCMYSYLGKEECVGGSWAIETRYPFLDTAFVQSFLSLHRELKNRNYKAPIYEYLRAEGFPFERDRKIGFALAA